MSEQGPCPWLVRRPNRNPEPDSIEDCYDTVACGAPTELTQWIDPTEPDHPHFGWQCANGHEHVPIEISLAPGGLEWQREQKDREDRSEANG